MPLPQRSVSIWSWTDTFTRAAEVTAWAASKRDDPDVSPDLRGRMSLAVYVGAATVHLRPTIAEATALIEALEWAVAHSEVPA
jgi:hypothetical protein